MKTKRVIFFGLLAFVISTLPACSELDTEQQPSASELPIAPVLPIYVRLSPTAPPEAPVEVPPPLDDLQHKTWRPGYWSYDNGQFTWVPGEVIAKPAFTAVWVFDHWEKREYGWAFVPGYWQ
jgi:hypothetical protein